MSTPTLIGIITIYMTIYQQHKVFKSSNRILISTLVTSKGTNLYHYSTSGTPYGPKPSDPSHPPFCSRHMTCDTRRVAASAPAFEPHPHLRRRRRISYSSSSPSTPREEKENSQSLCAREYIPRYIIGRYEDGTARQI